MSKKKYEFTERIVDSNGVERVYGYDKAGRKYFINIREVMDIYEQNGWDGFREVV